MQMKRKRIYVYFCVLRSFCRIIEAIKRVHDLLRLRAPPLAHSTFIRINLAYGMNSLRPPYTRDRNRKILFVIDADTMKSENRFVVSSQNYW